jgi:prepilin-type N-terminal cleavage/methylation domain-containing protein
MKNFSKSFKKGFTLIELLVVVAIIGILASVVLASLSTARTKGKDAAAEAEISSIRAQNEIFASSASGGYGTAETITNASASDAVSACGQAQTIALLSAINTNTGSTATCAVGVNGATWVAWSKLSSQTAPANFCADSSGFSGARTLAPTAVITAAVNCASS